ncbi:hypothetical protein GCM10011314_33920 [Knoellia flava]|uniref:Uncharacterized protein n=1 Tax=Knoellia flava TaxID=913969 RepID=A0A8H9FWB2_9MICO|nr:hypothetical protein GCM10011314_33920 [Knoellia flava]
METRYLAFVAPRIGVTTPVAETLDQRYESATGDGPHEPALAVLTYPGLDPPVTVGVTTDKMEGALGVMVLLGVEVGLVPALLVAVTVKV